MTPEPAAKSTTDTSKFAFLVAAGILLSRIAGLIRERVFAHYFGNSDAADVFKAALRIPNFLQNLFGEGVLSASFIPVYARLQAEGKYKAARTVARAVAFALIGLVTLLVILGITLTPYLVDLLAPGFDADKQEYVAALVRILFPATGVLVFSAWCLGILNSHSKFFLSYVAPVLWNAAIIIAIVLYGNIASGYALAEIAAWGVFVGSGLQLLVQLPSALLCLAENRDSSGSEDESGRENVRTVFRNFVPMVFSRGIIQISAYIDSMLASLLPMGAVAALSYAQTISVLPISLFALSVVAAELPQMSRAGARDSSGMDGLKVGIETGIRRISFFIVPSAVAFLFFGDQLSGALFQTGRFLREDTIYVWAILAGSAVGLLAAAIGRLLASCHFSYGDTQRPLYFSIIRVVISAALGICSALYLPDLLGCDRKWGVVGITIASGIGAWIEFSLLKRSLESHLGTLDMSKGFLIKLCGAALIGAVIGSAVRATLPIMHPVASAAVVLGTFGMTYLLVCMRAGIEETKLFRQKLGI